MKVTAVGDMFVPEEAFAKVLQHSDRVSEYTGTSWMAGADRAQARQIIRKIETEGSRAYHIDGELRRAMTEAEVLFVHLCPVDAQLIREAKDLRYIVTMRGGLENIAVDEAKEQGVRIINCPLHNAYAVAEMTIGMIIGETRNLARSDAALRHGEWCEIYPDSGHIRELRSMTVGIIGFGAIGRLVAERLVPFGSRVLVCDPFADPADIKTQNCEPADMETLLTESDVVTLHARLKPGDPPIIGPAELMKMKKQAVLVNTARAVLVDMDALTRALQTNEIGGAAIDVYKSEPADPNLELFHLDNCTVTNHRCGDTEDAYLRAPEMAFSQLCEAIDTGKTKYMV